jgi:hypothetical protein
MWGWVFDFFHNSRAWVLEFVFPKEMGKSSLFIYYLFKEWGRSGF